MARAKWLISMAALFIFNLAIATPYGGFSKWISYEPEVPEKLRKMKQDIL